MGDGVLSGEEEGGEFGDGIKGVGEVFVGGVDRGVVEGECGDAVGVGAVGGF